MRIGKRKKIRHLYAVDHGQRGEKLDAWPLVPSFQRPEVRAVATDGGGNVGGGKLLLFTKLF